MTKTINNYLLILSIVGFIFSLSVFGFFLSQTSGQSEIVVEAGNYTSDQIIAAVNRERRALNLPELVPNNQLNSAAQAKADHMQEYQYFSHIHSVTGKKWSDFIKESGYNYLIAGENLANGFDGAEKMVRAWMNSPTHRENIINQDVEETGVGLAVGEFNGQETTFVVQTFGKQE